MRRTISGFHEDDEGEWVAELDCGHNQHVRHRPPFQLRPWVLDEAGRATRRGAPIDCPLCDRCELPERVRFARRSPEWDAGSLPPGLRRAHRLAGGTWGRLVVREGQVRFRADTSPATDRLLDAGTVQALPPGVEHEVEPDERARLFVEFLQVVADGAVPSTERLPPERDGRDADGDPAEERR